MSRTSNPAEWIRMMGVRLGNHTLISPQFTGLYGAQVLDTNLTNPSVGIGNLRVIIPELNANAPWPDGIPYPGLEAPPDGTSAVVGFAESGALYIVAFLGWQPIGGPVALYASLTGPGQTLPIGDLTQEGGLTVNAGDSPMGIRLNDDGGGISLVETGTSGINIQDAGAGIHLTETGHGGIILIDNGTGGITLESVTGGILFDGVPSSSYFQTLGIPGATVSGRFMGTVSGGSPSFGTYVAGDYVIDVHDGTMWICTSGPSTWAHLTPGSSGSYDPLGSAATAQAAAIATSEAYTNTWAERGSQYWFLPKKWDTVAATAFAAATGGTGQFIICCEGDSITVGSNNNPSGPPQQDQWQYGFVGRLEQLLWTHFGTVSGVGFNYGATDKDEVQPNTSGPLVYGGTTGPIYCSGGFGQLAVPNSQGPNDLTITCAQKNGQYPTSLDLYTVDYNSGATFSYSGGSAGTQTVTQTGGNGLTTYDGGPGLRRTHIKMNGTAAHNITIGSQSVQNALIFAYAVINYSTTTGAVVMRNAMSGWRAVDMTVGIGPLQGGSTSGFNYVPNGFSNNQGWAGGVDGSGGTLGGTSKRTVANSGTPGASTALTTAPEGAMLTGDNFYGWVPVLANPITASGSPNSNWTSNQSTDTTGSIVFSSTTFPTMPAPHLVILGFGANDLIHGGSRVAAFERYWVRRIHAARAARKDASILILDTAFPSPYSDNQLPIDNNAAESHRYKRIKRMVADTYGCAYLDVDTLFGETPAADGNMSAGHIHPTANGGGAGGGDGHMLIAQTIYNLLVGGPS